MQFAADDRSAALYRVLALDPRQTVTEVKASLRYQVCPAVACVLQLAVEAADQRDSSQQWSVAVDDAELRTEVNIVEGIQESVERSHEAYPCFIHHRRAQRAGQSN